MNSINFLTRWKIQLDSNSKELQVVALVEILDFFANLNDDYENIYVLLINSDISHFLSQILSYQDRVTMSLISKIVCSLSETDEFFRNDFFVVLKGYLRVIHSFPTTYGSKSTECYHQNIFKCVSILVKRARERDCIFKEDQITCLALNVFNLNKVHLENCPALDLINLTIELMTTFPAEKACDVTNRNNKLNQSLRNLSTRPGYLEHHLFILLLSKVLHNALCLLPTVEMMTSEFKLIRSTIIDKFLAMMDFILKENIDYINYEIFINLFFYLLTSTSFKLKHKMQLLNRLFVLNGHNFLLTVSAADGDDGAENIRSKSRIVLAKVLETFAKFITKSPDSDHKLSTRCFEIMLNSKSQMPIDGELRLESMLMFIFMKFVDYTWNNPILDRPSVFSNVSLILAITRERNEVLEPAFNKMLTTLFTATFIKISMKKNSLLKVSSKVLLATTNSSQIDLNYLRWWYLVVKPKKTVLNNVVTKFLGKLEPGQFDNLQPKDCEMFDLKLMMRMFLDNSTKMKLHNCLSQVLCNFTSIEATEYQKLLDEGFKVLRLASCKKKHRVERLKNVMDVMNAGAESLVDMNVKRKTAEVLSKTLHQPSSTPHVKLAAVQIATNLLRVKN